MSSAADLGVAVFARTPGAGGKSRLAATLGRKKTDEFYLYCLNCAKAWLAGCGSETIPYWALTGPGSYARVEWGDVQILDQGTGGLGQRMYHVSHCLSENHRQWCLVGTDIPQMPQFADLEISSRLRHSDFVFGPATDGGFWLIAGRHRIPAPLWSRVRYSQNDTLHRLKAVLREEFAGSIIDTGLPALTDIDQEEDLDQLREALQREDSKLNPEQRSLLNWLL